jgi:DNA-binding NtrC family response regulator
MASFLIIDEDRNFREALAIALRLDGHETTVVATPEDARARLDEGRFTCCVIDAHISGADTLLEAAVASGARVIATGPYVELLETTAARHPRAQTLAKPFRAFDLARVAFAGQASATG